MQMFLLKPRKPITRADLCPGFWLALARQHDAKRVFSLDRIRAEIVVVSGPLSDWARQEAPSGFFKETADKAVVDQYAALVNWVQNERQFTLEAKAQFASVADGWIVAYAKVNGLILVTHELYAPEAKKRVPIPNVCLEFDVEYCNTFEMLRELKEQFVLKTRRRKR